VLGSSRARKKTGLASMMKVRGKFWFLLLWLLRRRNMHDDFIPDYYSVHLHTLVIFCRPSSRRLSHSCIFCPRACLQFLSLPLSSLDLIACPSPLIITECSSEQLVAGRARIPRYTSPTSPTRYIFLSSALHRHDGTRHIRRKLPHREHPHASNP
jgi:hypothetical protein